MIQQILFSFSRYFLIGLTASVQTYLVNEMGVDADAAEKLATHAAGLVPAILAIVWSFKKNKKQNAVNERYKEEVPPKKRDKQFLKRKGLRNEDFNS